MRRSVFSFFIVLALSQADGFSQLDTVELVEGVGIDEHLGDQINLNLEFIDLEGNRVKLRDFIDGSKPTIIAPVYYNCPQLCTLVLNGVANLIDNLDLQLGTDYQVLNISIDPTNTPDLAAQKAANYCNALSEPEVAAKNWHFLTGEEANVVSIMDQVGFRYKKVDDQYSHTSAIVFVSPKGLITRYIYGVKYSTRDARLATIEASDGKVGSTLERVFVYCFRYDPLAGKYVPYAWGIMRVGALLTLAFMLLAGFILWRAELTKKWRLRQNV